MSVSDYISVLRYRWRLVALGTAIGLFVGFASYLATPPTYSASSSLYVSSQGGDASTQAAYQGSLLSTQRIKSYVELMTSGRILEGAARTVPFPVDVADLRSRVAASAVPETVLLTVSVTDESPDRAAQLANAITTSFLGVTAELEAPSDTRPPPVTTRVVEQATPPSSAIAPRASVYLVVGLFFGLVAGLAAGLFRDRTDRSFKSAEEIQAATGWPTLGVVSFDEKLANSSSMTSLRSLPVGRAEEFRKIRTSIQFVDVDAAPTVVVFSSALPGEGKTTVAVNCALAMKDLGLRILVVEADLRRPRVATYCGLEGSAGLTSVLAGRATLDDVIQKGGSTFFDFLSSGPLPPNPSELLASQQMRSVLETLRTRYDFVLIDSPPVIPVTDAAILASRCDGVFVVFRYAQTTSDQASAAAAAFSTVSAKVLGAIINATPPKADTAYDRYDQDLISVQQGPVDQFYDSTTVNLDSTAMPRAGHRPPSPRPR
ncbi:polysaccharide biosynthesis tyrosine autokinase [Actinomycetospora sp. CA-101289]|uniref:polysaccharide biosynthesis tyrosine autokinase n=1 Tax=Actinomycetospora sp. CA-101289 TaxID=3239893 RepID=UPI003D96B6E4